MKITFLWLQLLFVFFLNITYSQVRFQKMYGETNSSDRGKAVAKTFDGGYILLGQTQSFSANNFDLYLIRTDSYGDTIWTCVYSTSETLMPLDVIQTPDSNFVIAANIQDSNGNQTSLLLKTDANGDTLWTRTYHVGYGSNLACAALDLNGGIILAGGCYPPGHIAPYISLIKTDSLGAITWTKALGLNDNLYDISIKLTFDNSYIIAGSYYSFSQSYNDIFLIKTDNYGNPIWSKVFRGSADDRCLDVTQASDSGYILTGTTSSFGLNSETYLLKTNSSGDLQWAKAYGNASWARWVSETTDHGIYCLSSWPFVLKTNSMGDTLWSVHNTKSGSINFSACLTDDGGIAIVGYSNETGGGSNDLYLIKCDSTGSSNCNETSGSISQVTSFNPQIILPVIDVQIAPDSIAYPTIVTNKGGIITDLCLDMSQDFDPNFIYVNIHPNPTSNDFIILSSEVILSVEILNLLGERQVAPLVISDSKLQVTVNASSLRSGIYFSSVITLNGIESKIFVKH